MTRPPTRREPDEPAEPCLGAAPASPAAIADAPAAISLTTPQLPPTLVPNLAQVAASRIVWVAAWGLAAGAHGALLYALTREPADAMAGGGGQLVDAISVTMVNSSVLESREPDKPQPSPPAAAAQPDANDGTPDSASAPSAEKQRESAKEQQVEQETRKRSDEPISTADAILEAPRQEQHRKMQESAAPVGGAAARSDASIEKTVRTTAPAAASAGAVREYARYVALALSKNKPKGLGGHGTVRVRFVIATTGDVASVEVAKSSGNNALDDSAIESVRRTKFPLPPAGMTVSQLTYEVPYHFR